MTEDRPIDIVAEELDAGIRTGDTVPRDMIALRLGLTRRLRWLARPAISRASP